MAKAKQNLNLKIQMLAGKGTKEFFERLYKNLTSLDGFTYIVKSLALIYVCLYYYSILSLIDHLKDNPFYCIMYVQRKIH